MGGDVWNTKMKLQKWKNSSSYITSNKHYRLLLSCRAGLCSPCATPWKRFTLLYLAQM